MGSDISLIRNWLDSLGELSNRTIVQYEREATRFQAWLSLNGQTLTDCGPDNIAKYFAVLRTPPHDENLGFHIRRRKALTESSIGQSRRILGLLLSWLSHKGYATRNPLDRPSRNLYRFNCNANTENKSPTVDAPAVWESVASNIDRSSPEEVLRSRVIAHLAFWSGVSSSEIPQLKLGDIQYDNGIGYLQLPLSTDHNKHQVELSPATLEVIDAYVSARAERGLIVGLTEPLVCSLRGGRGVSSWTVWHAVRSSGQNEYAPSPQQLRRTFQESAIQGGLQERMVAKHLRRFSLQPKVTKAGDFQVDTRKLYDVVHKVLEQSAFGPHKPNILVNPAPSPFQTTHPC